MEKGVKCDGQTKKADNNHIIDIHDCSDNNNNNNIICIIQWPTCSHLLIHPHPHHALFPFSLCS
jgi:hypothetical protein